MQSISTNIFLFTAFIIVYIGGAGASRVGYDPVYGRHTDV